MILRFTTQKFSSRIIVILQEEIKTQFLQFFIEKTKQNKKLRLGAGKREKEIYKKNCKKIKRKTQIVKAAKIRTNRSKNWTEKAGLRKHNGRATESNVDKQSTIFGNKKEYRNIKK